MGPGGAWRTFRVDRVDAAEPLGGQVRFVDPPDPVQLVAEAVTVGPYTWSALVRLELPHTQAVRRVPPTVGQPPPRT